MRAIVGSQTRSPEPWTRQAPGAADSRITQAGPSVGAYAQAREAELALVVGECGADLPHGRPLASGENRGALGWTLEAADREALRRDYPHRQDRSAVYALR